MFPTITPNATFFLAARRKSLDRTRMLQVRFKVETRKYRTGDNRATRTAMEFELLRGQLSYECLNHKTDEDIRWHNLFEHYIISIQLLLLLF